MAWGTLTIGSLVLKETDILEDVTNANTGERTVRISGAETNPGNGTGSIEAKQQDIMGLMGRIMPVQFERKASYNGYYRATDTNTELEQWGEGPGQVRWALTLELVGSENVLDLESRVANVARSNDFGKAGERWHAPPTGHYGYFVGSVAPATVVRQTDTGPITVYRSIPAGVNPRWGCSVAGYGGGRVRFLSGGLERVADRIPVPVTDWEMNNGLVRVRPHTAATLTTLLVAHYDGIAWREKAYDVRVAGDSLRPSVEWQSVTVTRLEPEVVTLRAVIKQPSNGQRVLLDLTLRRGARFVEGYVQRTTSGELAIVQDVAEYTQAFTGYVTAGGGDASGLRYAVGSARLATTTGGGQIKSAATGMDFYIGAEIPKAIVGGTNYGFEAGATGWSVFNGTFSLQTGGARWGANYGRATAAAAGVDLRMDYTEAGSVGAAGKSYTVSGWVRSPIAVTAGNAQLGLHWFNGATYMNTVVFPAPALLAGVWTPVVGTAVAPANTTLIGRQAVLLPGVVAVGTVLEVDSLDVREAVDSGDSLSALYDQYIGAMAEKVGVVKR